MAIYGEFRIEKYKNTIRNMKPGKSAYVFMDRAYLDKKFFVIHLDSEVFYSIEEVLEIGFSFIKITRKKRSNTAESFDLDLDVDDNFITYLFPYIDRAEIKQKVNDIHHYVSFKNPPIFFDRIDEKIMEAEEEEKIVELKKDTEYFENLFNASPIEKLQGELSIAVENEDYERAAEIRDLIEKRQKNKKNKGS